MPTGTGKGRGGQGDHGSAVTRGARSSVIRMKYPADLSCMRLNWEEVAAVRERLLSGRPFGNRFSLLLKASCRVKSS
jgi:hypothetical protein